MKKFIIHTLGCKVNSYESQFMKELLIKNGYCQTESDSDVDVIIINSCAVTKMAEHKSRQKVSSFAKKYPNAVMVMTGCCSQLHVEMIKKLSCVNIIMGNNQHAHLLDNINNFLKNKQLIIDVDTDVRHRQYQNISITNFDDHVRAFVKIADGCDNFCSYCVIPYIRGNFRSRNEEEVLCEINTLVNNGYHEIVLTGIDFASYGEEKHLSLNSLLKKICQVPNLKRLSISSIEASQIDDEFIEIFKNNKVIARHLHIPLQSGSQSVLKRMNRKYDKDEFYQKILKVINADGDVFLACDVIAGFPDESEEEFLETYDFIKKCNFSYLHVFPYSSRDNTVAARMKNQVPSQIKKDRVSRLLKLSEELYRQYQEKMVGRKMNFLIESYDEKTKSYHGLSEYFLPINIKSDSNLINTFIEKEYHV